MLTFVDFQKRSNEGPLMSSGDFDLMLSKKAREIVKRYGLRKLDMENILADDESADLVFQAAVDFLVEVGVYNNDTQRVIQWSREEVLELAADYKNNPRVFTLGKGEDEITIRPRTSQDTWAPVIMGAGGPIFNQKAFVPCIKAFAQEKCVKGLTAAGNMPVVNGVPATKGLPGETYCSIWEAKSQTEALEAAGRPGLFRGLVPTATSLGAILASMGPGKFEPHNILVGIHIMPEQKVDWERLNIAYALEELGVVPWSSAMSVMGGLAGGPGGAAMCCVANLLAQLSYGHGPWCNVSLNDMAGSSKNREVLKGRSLAQRAVERNIGVAFGTMCIDTVNATCHEEAILGGFAIALVGIASGMAIHWFSGSSPLTARMHDEVARNVAGMEPEKVNRMLDKILEKITQLQETHAGNVLPLNKRIFPAIYDIETLKPHDDYLEAVKNSVQMLKDCGVPITDALVLD